MSSVLAAVSSLPVISLPTAVGDPYTVAQFGTDLAAGAAGVLPWVGAGVAAGIVLMFAFMGIKKGIAFFRGTAK